MRLTLNSRPVLSGRWIVFAALIGAVVCIVGGLLVFGRSQTAPAAEQLRQAAGRQQVTPNDQLIWSYQETARTNPQNADARAILALAYLQKARETGDPSYYAKAGSVIDEALKIDPKHLDALIARGSLALARHQFAEALAIGLQARDIAPRVARTYGVIADAQIELGHYEEAVETVQSMVDTRPDLSSYTRVSYMRELYGDLDGAIDMMDRAVRAGGPSRENVEWTRVQLGNLYFAKGDLAGAERQYLVSLSVDPNYVYALAGLARVRAAQGDTAKAVELYQSAIDRNPLPEFVIALGELYQATGQARQAEQQYQLVRAMQQLLTSSGVDTDLELALFEADHGADPQAALALARRAYERRPGIKGADTLAWALYKTGRYDEAQSYAARSLVLGTKDASFYYHAGMIANARGDLKSARSYLEEAMKLNPHFSPLHVLEIDTVLSTLPTS
jgi:tetratricopeptide (TPR) repeat protein